MLELDPLALRLLNKSLDLLKSKSVITIEDLIDCIGVKRSSVTRRIALIVKLKHLAVVKSSGRRPNYYFSPKPLSDSANTIETIRTLEMISNQLDCQSKKIMAQLKLVNDEKELLQQNIKKLKQESINVST